MEPIDPNDDTALDDLLSKARWPEPSAASTRRLKAAWAQISPSGKFHRRRRVRTAAAVAAVVLFALGLAMMLPRSSKFDKVTNSRVFVPPPQTTMAPIAETRRAPRLPTQPQLIRMASVTDRDMIASDKLAIWSEIQRPARRNHAIVHPRNRGTSSRPAPITTPSDIDSPAQNLAAIRVQLARY